MNTLITLKQLSDEVASVFESVCKREGLDPIDVIRSFTERHPTKAEAEAMKKTGKGGKGRKGC